MALQTRITALAQAVGADVKSLLAAMSGKLSDAPSDGKTYGRKNAAWAETAGGGAVAGDTLTTLRTPLPQEGWLEPNTVYAQPVYPGLFGVLGVIPNVPDGRVALPAVTDYLGNSIKTVSWSPDGRYFFASVSGSPTTAQAIVVYRRDGLTLTKIANPASGHTEGVSSASFTPDGAYLAVVAGFRWFAVSDDGLVKLPNPATVPGNPTKCAWSPDGTYLAVTQAASPYILIYKRIGNALYLLDNPATLPTGWGRGVSWTPDGVYLTVGHEVTPFITTYKRAGDTFTKLANPASLPGQRVPMCTWSPTGTYLVAHLAGSPYIAWYKRNGDVLTKLANPASLPNSFSGFGVQYVWHPSGDYLALVEYNRTKVGMYSRSGDTLVRMADTNVPDAEALAWSPDRSIFAVGNYNAPYVVLYGCTTYDPLTQFITPAFAAPEAPLRTYIKG